jgi:hypothetical protein
MADTEAELQRGRMSWNARWERPMKPADLTYAGD